MSLRYQATIPKYKILNLGRLLVDLLRQIIRTLIETLHMLDFVTK